MDSRAPRRRTFQFSLGTMLLLVAIVAGVASRVDFTSASMRLKLALARGWPCSLVHLNTGYMEHTAERYAFGRFDKCVFVRASAVWGGRVHVLLVLFRLDQMIWPLPLLAAPWAGR